MGLPKISNYGNYSSDNYGAHTLQVEIESVTVWFSYQTPVAFRAPGIPLIVRKNEWGPTTGKHLKWIDGCDSKKNDRVDFVEFKKLWEEHVKPCFEKPEGLFSGLVNL